MKLSQQLHADSDHEATTMKKGLKEKQRIKNRRASAKRELQGTRKDEEHSSNSDASCEYEELTTWRIFKDVMH
jgi:hypothetical protein